MAKLELLDKLKDIHLPAPVGLWPLALGWWFLLLFLIALVIATWFFKRWQKHHLVKKKFLLRLRDYKKQYKINHNSVWALNQIAILLKQVALFYYPRTQVASLHGHYWVQFLELSGPKNYSQFLMEWFTVSLYQANTDIDVKEGFIFAEKWIKQQGARCMN